MSYFSNLAEHRKNFVLELNASFQEATIELLNNCASRGIKMVPYSGVRTPKEQAILWRRSRSRNEIMKKVDFLRQERADYLADCILEVGPQYGRWCTNAIPGLSWHQWGEAIDCFWEVNNRAEWDITKYDRNGLNGYMVFAAEAKAISLTAGGYWRIRDWPHVQLSRLTSPLKEISYSEISNEMELKFEN